MLGSFATIVSHDLRAPLRGIHRLSQFLEEDLADKLDGDQVEGEGATFRFTWPKGYIYRLCLIKRNGDKKPGFSLQNQG